MAGGNPAGRVGREVVRGEGGRREWREGGTAGGREGGLTGRAGGEGAAGSGEQSVDQDGLPMEIGAKLSQGRW